MAVTRWLSRFFVAAACLGGMTAEANDNSTNAALDAGIQAVREAQSAAPAPAGILPPDAPMVTRWPSII